MFIESDDALRGTFLFDDFVDAFAFMTKVAHIAEELGHHPDMSISWNQVTIECSTHDAGGVVTDRDHDLARRIVAAR